MQDVCGEPLYAGQVTCSVQGARQSLSFEGVLGAVP